MDNWIEITPLEYVVLWGRLKTPTVKTSHTNPPRFLTEWGERGGEKATLRVEGELGVNGTTSYYKWNAQAKNGGEETE